MKQEQENEGERHWERPWERYNLNLTHNSIHDLKSEMVYVLGDELQSAQPLRFQTTDFKHVLHTYISKLTCFMCVHFKVRIFDTHIFLSLYVLYTCISTLELN